MTQLLNFSAPKQSDVDYTPAEVTDEMYETYPWFAPEGGMLVLKPTVSDTTKTGIKKSDSQIAEELRKMDYPMTVLKQSKEASVLGYKRNTKIVVNRFTATNLPSPLEGYDVVFVRVHEVLAYSYSK
jgi:hypothetical protein